VYSITGTKGSHLRRGSLVPVGEAAGQTRLARSTDRRAATPGRPGYSWDELGRCSRRSGLGASSSTARKRIGGTWPRPVVYSRLRCARCHARGLRECESIFTRDLLVGVQFEFGQYRSLLSVYRIPASRARRRLTARFGGGQRVAAAADGSTRDRMAGLPVSGEPLSRRRAPMNVTALKR